MTRLASRFGNANVIRRDRALTNDELAQYVPSVLTEDKHESRSDRYTYIPTITLLDKLREEGFDPFFACQSRVRDQNKRNFTKHMIRLRRRDVITRAEVPEIILLNSHDGSSSYQMIPGYFRFVCTNGMVCGDTFAEIRVPHKGDIVSQVIEGAYEVLGIFDKVENSAEEMKTVMLDEIEQRIFAAGALSYRYDDAETFPITESQVLAPRRREDNKNDLWTTFQRVQENIIKGGITARNAKGKRTTTRAINGIDGDVKLNRILWRMAEHMRGLKS